MSAIGPKQTSLAALHMSAFGGRADMAALKPFVAFPASDAVPPLKIAD